MREKVRLESLESLLHLKRNSSHLSSLGMSLTNSLVPEERGEDGGGRC